MAYQLIIVEGPDAGRVIAVDDGQTLTIGRGDQNDTRLADATVSRVHCEINRHGDVVTICDRGSSGGTRVNGNPVQQAELAVGAFVQLGSTLLRLSLPGMDDETTRVSGSQQTPDRPLHELVGSTVGKWRIDETIGHGVTGIVFKAWDTEKERVAALKVLTPMYSRSEEQRNRFVRGMKTMLPIRDPHIVRLYNAGISGPYCWAAMEYVDGENLSELIERTGIDGMLDWRKVWRVAMDIGSALKTGYEHQVIHRNVTPTNILRRAADESCLLADFMLAKATEGDLSVQVTQVGQIVGEIPYMAPERTFPGTEADTRADMYGLGATCYALLTGQPPVCGGTMAEQIDKARNQKPELPKHFQLAVDDVFQDVVMKLLEKDPADRYQEPGQLLDALERIGKFNNLSAG